MNNSLSYVTSTEPYGQNIDNHRTRNQSLSPKRP
jgi:hypothetical protein